MSIPRRLILGATAVVALLLTTTTTAGAAQGPELPGFATAFLYSQGNPDVDPPGANDWTCKPSAAHPHPVVLVHGTWENRYNNFAKMSPALKRAGYCVFALDYGDTELNGFGMHPAVKGTGDIRTSAKEFKRFVDKVLAATGTSQVDVVGHSQGGMMPRQYLKFEGGAGKVRNLVTLGATHHGTTLSGIATLAEALKLLGMSGLLIGTAGVQQAKGSEFLAALNAGGDTVPGVAYTVIATKFDEVTTPYQSTFLTAGPGATVKNITLQDTCLLDLSDHLALPYSDRVIAIVKNTLGGTTNPVPCVPVLPVV
ncbi:esterase/lipase family protein [Actinokineospora sp. HUAS TT18]|uniref:esterase/lipase family protein n=1 Tax=Actinokineospora sp. HUAS TT18 TaxID=3447451 RepID=UPI003F524D15